MLDALREICPAVRPGRSELRLAAELADRHGLTFYDAVYAAVASARQAALATLARALLNAGLGRRPSELVAELGAGR